MLATSAIPMLGRIDNFWVIIAIVIGSVLWDWLKKKGRPEDTDSLPSESESPRSGSVPRPSTTPARLLGLDDRGSIEPGRRADLVALDYELGVEAVWVGGRPVERAG